MNVVENQDLPEITNSAGIYGSGDAVFGPPCYAIIAVVLFATTPSR